MKDLLKNARLAKNLKTSEVARILKIDVALISKFESGGRIPTKDQLPKLADLLDIDSKQLEISWLKLKILAVCADSDYAREALQSALSELGETQAPQVDVMPSFQKLMDEMESLKSILATQNKSSR